MGYLPPSRCREREFSVGLFTMSKNYACPAKTGLGTLQEHDWKSQQLSKCSWAGMPAARTGQTGLPPGNPQASLRLGQDGESPMTKPAGMGGGGKTPVHLGGRAPTVAPDIAPQPQPLSNQPNGNGQAGPAAPEWKSGDSVWLMDKGPALRRRGRGGQGDETDCLPRPAGERRQIHRRQADGGGESVDRQRESEFSNSIVGMVSEAATMSAVQQHRCAHKPISVAVHSARRCLAVTISAQYAFQPSRQRRSEVIVE